MRRRHKAYLMAVAALLLTGILTFNNFDGAVKVEAARNTLDRIETITSDHTSENSSWKILEIVPGASVNIPADAANDVKEAALPAGNIGYLIGGQEPYKKLSDYEERSNMIRYLKSKNALSAITGENAPLTAMGGDYREYLEDMIEESVSVDQITSIGTGDIVSFNTISMLRDISGNYVKLFISNNGIVSGNKAAEYITGGDTTDFDASTDGDLQPAFRTASAGDAPKFEAAFEPIDPLLPHKYGYVVANYQKIGKVGESWDEEKMSEGQRIYTMSEDGIFWYAGTLSVNSANISVNSVPAGEEATTVSSSDSSVNSVMTEEEIVTVSSSGVSENLSMNDQNDLVYGTISGGKITEDQAAASNDDSKDAENKNKDEDTGNSNNEGVEDISEGKREEEVTQSDNSSDDGIKEETVSEENVASDNSAENLTEEEAEISDEPDIEWEEKFKIMASGALSEGDELYVVNFRFVEDGDSDTDIYHIMDWTVSDNGTYSLDTSRILVPDVTGEGCVKEKDSSKAYIVYQYEPGNGTYLPNLSGGDTIYERGAKVYIGGAWINNEWFKNYVFDRDLEEEFKNLNIEVITKAASDVKVSDIEGVNFVYIAAHGNYFLGGANDGEYKKGGSDLSYDVAAELLKRASEEDKDTPILVERAILDGQDSCVKNLADAFCLNDYESALKQFKSVSGASAVSGNKTEGSFVRYRVYMFDGNTVNKDFNASISGNGFTDVIRYITYVNNLRSSAKKVDVFLSEATAIRHIIAYEDRIIKGIYRVLEIQPEDIGAAQKFRKDAKINKNLKIGSNDITITLNYDLSKEKDAEGYTALYYQDHSPHSPSSNIPYSPYSGERRLIFRTKGDIVLTHMSVHEFIGRVDDLNSDYDMIFIGADTSGNNSMAYNNMYDDSPSKNEALRISNGISEEKWYGPLYNDEKLNGYIYMGTGDLYHAKVNGNKYRNSPGYVKEGDFGKDITRFDNSDILNADIERLKEFAEAELPIIIDDKLLNSNLKGPNSETVQDHSTCNMYTAIKDLRGESDYKDSVFPLSEVVKDNLELLEHLEVARPSVELVKVNGEEVSDSGRVVDAKPKEGDDGKYEAVIEFRIEDDLGDDDTKYTAEFYLDRNADGKYAASEIDTANVNFSSDRTDLRKGETYTITRTFNEYQMGVVPWRIIIYQNGGDAKKLRRSNITGYSRIERTERPKVKILQLMSAKGDSGNDNTINMETNYNNNSTTMGKYLRDANKRMYFDLEIVSARSDYFVDGNKSKLTTKMTSEKVLNLSDGEDNKYLNIIKQVEDASSAVPTAEDYLEVYRQYDLIICGFGDWYFFGNYRTGASTHLSRIDQASIALRQYVNEGRSILISHDTVIADVNYRNPFSDNLMDLAGMNRFGAQGKTDTGGTQDVPLAYSGMYDERGDDETTYGPTYLHPMRSNYRSGDDDYGYNRLVYNGGYDGQAGNYKEVTQVNEGQITKYPYDLGNEPFMVRKTHAQDFQLNFNIDADSDKKSDLVVWYCIGQGSDKSNASEMDKTTDLEWNIHRASYNDVRNNYFIYSKGNITYTGQGHSAMYDCSEMEAKLFINTLVTAYSTGVHDPAITIHSSSDPNSPVKESDVLPFDTGLMDELFTKNNEGQTELTYVKPEAVPDNGDGDAANMDAATGPYITMYFKPEELNVNVESTATEVAFFVEDANGSEIKGPAVNGVTGQVVLEKASRISEASIKLEKINSDAYGNELSRTVVGQGTAVASGSDGGVGIEGVPGFTLDALDGQTMYAVTFPLSAIVDKQTLKEIDGIQVPAVNNLPKVYAVLHNHSRKFTVDYDRYATATMKYARAQLFMLE
ncbi:MAG: DUF5057 domain-containing protein [Lachnospiraceae bacterium]|nr:DUF5057 domain-containing protein [Lachnospiraceae bacterium]